LDEPSSVERLWAIDWIPWSVRLKAREVEKAYVALDELLSVGSERGDRLKMQDAR
jgi:hypothetical protein